MDTATVETTKQPKAWRPQTGYIVVAGVILAVIIFAFIWEALLGDSVYTKKYRPADVQAELAQLDWITPRLLPPNPYSRPQTPVTQINGIAIHFVDNPGTTAEQNRNYFANLAFTNANIDTDADKTYASSNFIVGLDGEVLQCVPIDEIAYCTTSRNWDTISIECCHPDATGEFNEQTYASLVRLTAYLCKSFGLTGDSLIRHYDVTGKDCPRFFVQNPVAWEQFKADVDVAIAALPPAA